MIYTTTVTQKGQATIPVAIRQFLGIKPYDKVTFIKKEDEVVLKSAKDFLSLRGSIKTEKKYSDIQADKKVSQFIAKNYAKKNTTD